MPQNAQPPATAQVLRARNAVSVVFAVNGLAIATWMSRIPQARDLLGATPGELGMILLAMAAGSLVALPTAGAVVTRAGATRSVTGGAVVAGAGLILAGIGADTMSSAAITAAGLAALGYGSGTWDVAMNVEGAAVERLLGRTIMPRFHAAWSLGGVSGAGLGAGMVAAGVPVMVHLAVVGAVVMVTPAVVSRHFLAQTTAPSDIGPSGSVWTAWREPRTLAIGVLVLCFALIEGVAGDWLALGIVDGYGASNAVGAAGFALFITCMMIGRTVGTQLVDRYGRLTVLLTTATMTAAGVLLVVYGGTFPLATLGIVMWGLGASLGFPLGMSAASDDPSRAAARVSVVASIGYTGFLAGPPILGWLGDHDGVLRSLLVVVLATIVAVFAAPAAQPPGRTRPVS